MNAKDINDPARLAQRQNNPMLEQTQIQTYTSTHTETEQTSFHGQGMVRATDGRDEIAFSMSRSYSESVSLQILTPAPAVRDPLVLDFAGSAANLTDIRFAFDLDADGTMDDMPVIGGSGYLAFDRNGNKRIDDGRELFGPASGHGFRELAALDDDGNGWIDENDAAFAKLRVWQPDERGGGSLQNLKEAGIGALYLGKVTTPFSLRNAENISQGEIRTSGIYLREDGAAGTLSQVDLVV
jgi:hypothetical protein